MLTYIFAFVLGLAPALQAVFDLPLQLALQRALLLGCLAWAGLRAWRGQPPAPGARSLWLLWAAAGLSLASLLASPFRGQIFGEWGNFAAGLLIFVFASFLNKEERGRVEGAILAGAWAVFALSLAQAFALDNFHDRPPLTNLNALALYAVMIFPLALERKSRWPLAGAMLVLVIWTQSLGAALAGLAAAGYYAATRPAGTVKGSGLMLAALGAAAVGILWVLQADSLAGRLVWWRGAWDMFLTRPLSGFGHASYTWAQAAFLPDGAFRERSIYAHNYYLEFLAENGLPAALAWFAVIFAAVRARAGLAKYSLLAALAHSLMDFGLSVPANFWLFCFLLASPASSEAAPRPRSAVWPGIVFAGLLLAALAALDLRALAFERAGRRAQAAAEAGDLAAAESELGYELRPGLLRGRSLELLGQLSLRDDGAPPGFRSAGYFEQALLENSYSPAAWRGLRRIYAQPGLERAAAGLEQRRREVFK
jgi:O-antigen ligase